MLRPMCHACNSRPRAVAYHKYDRVYYRRLCDACLRKGKKIKAPSPRWSQAGYKKKKKCDRCGFQSRYSAQLMVYHINGDLNDVNLHNLKTVCLNCSVEIIRDGLPWRRGDLEPDY